MGHSFARIPGKCHMSILRLADARRIDTMSLSTNSGPLRNLYENLLSEPSCHRVAAQAFLEDKLQEVEEKLRGEQLQKARDQADDLPLSPKQLPLWMKTRTMRVTQEYNHYLQARRQGEPRRYFSNRAHAMYFLRTVAPTKLVDGAWLYGLLPHWREARLRPLVQTYLEELGSGVAARNHVLIYRHLLITLGCDDLTSLGDEHYLQGTLQLALGQLAAQYLPEVIGFNLGYEQLPLHLLITAYELDELGIDPHYFRLHVTIDNAATGHAQKAVCAVLDNLPVIGDARAFYRRVTHGYRLNDIGVGSTAVISCFDIERELQVMLERKREFAGNVHSDFCRVEGRTVNDWLSGPRSVMHFLKALQKAGWIRRHQDPKNSRFWQLVNGDRAAMFGVFTDYEQQLLHDWIAGDWQYRTVPWHLQRAKLMSRDEADRTAQPAMSEGPTLPAEVLHDEGRDEIDSEQRELELELAKLSAEQYEQRLITLASPMLHPTPAGLLATRKIASAVG
jgi:hypothetical protein